MESYKKSNLDFFLPKKEAIKKEAILLKFNIKCLNYNYSQACLKRHLYITNHCLQRAPLHVYNKSLSIKGTSI